jgi:hypothetical protein
MLPRTWDGPGVNSKMRIEIPESMTKMTSSLRKSVVCKSIPSMLASWGMAWAFSWSILSAAPSRDEPSEVCQILSNLPKHGSGVQVSIRGRLLVNKVSRTCIY